MGDKNSEIILSMEEAASQGLVDSRYLVDILKQSGQSVGVVRVFRDYDRESNFKGIIDKQSKLMRLYMKLAGVYQNLYPLSDADFNSFKSILNSVRSEVIRDLDCIEKEFNNAKSNSVLISLK